MSAAATIRCTVFGPDGERTLVRELPAIAREVPYHAPVADRTSVGEIMVRDIACAAPDLSIEKVTALVIERRVGCVPVVDSGGIPVGIITKLDLVTRGTTSRRAREVMAPMAAALAMRESATIAHAASMMLEQDTHHVLVVDAGGTLIGVVSSTDIVRWVLGHNTLATRRDASCGPPDWHPLDGAS